MPIMKNEVVAALMIAVQEITDAAFERIGLNLAIDNLLLNTVEVTMTIVIDNVHRSNTHGIQRFGGADIWPIQCEGRNVLHV